MQHIAQNNSLKAAEIQPHSGTAAANARQWPAPPLRQSASRWRTLRAVRSIFWHADGGCCWLQHNPDWAATRVVGPISFLWAVPHSSLGLFSSIMLFRESRANNGTPYLCQSFTLIPGTIIHLFVHKSRLENPLLITFLSSVFDS